MLIETNTLPQSQTGNTTTRIVMQVFLLLLLEDALVHNKWRRLIGSTVGDSDDSGS